MKKALKKAVEAHDLPLIRTLLIDLVTNHKLDTSTIETITEVMEQTPDLFEEAQVAFPVADEPETMAEALEDSLRQCFTLQAFEQLVESKLPEAISAA